MKTQEMTETQFDAAWQNSPPTKVAAMLLEKGIVVRVDRPMDAHWAFKGTVPDGPMDIVAACCCQQDLKDWKWSGPPEPIPEVKGRVVRVICVGFRVAHKSTEQKRHLYTWYFIGQCPECRHIYWFRR